MLAALALCISACQGGREFSTNALARADLPESTMRAGVGVADATWNVGVSAGQYSEYNAGLATGLFNGPLDPNLYSTTKSPSNGVQSRLSARALVIEGGDGTRVALLKSDNYLAQDLLLRRVGQILDEGSSGVRYDNIMYSASHNHSSPYNSTLAVGVWLFQDAFDQRKFEFQARAFASAIEQAAANLQPARIGATTVPVIFEGVPFKGNIAGRGASEDGTPYGYPQDFGDHGMVVMRVDSLKDDEPSPMAVWINYGQHPESLDGYNLISEDYLAPLERFVERDLGIPLVFSQGDVGSAEGPYDRDDAHVWSNGVKRAWGHVGWAQAERGGRLLADAVICGWEQIGAEPVSKIDPRSLLRCDSAAPVQVPFQYDAPVSVYSAWVPGPISHPVPTVSNCNTATTTSGNIGIPVAGLPDCERQQLPEFIDPVVNNFAVHALPLPDHYGAPGAPLVEENLRLRLQALRLGEIVFGSCSCEAQVDLILNFESRADAVSGNRFDGFDWSCLVQPEDPMCRVQNTIAWGNQPQEIPGSLEDESATQHMRAQVHNDAAGWDTPANALAANRENADSSQLWGNFTHQEIQDLGGAGYKLAVGMGHTGDYNGYTVSYREYMARDHYRKALTAYGAHTADYMVTRMVRMANHLQGGPLLENEPTEFVNVIDEVRQSAEAAIIGLQSALIYDSYLSLLPNDAGSPEIIAEPEAIQRFNAATLSWRGGNNAIDNPNVIVEKREGDEWQRYADMTGEVQTKLDFPEGVTGVIQADTGMHEWIWHANFEAFTAFPRRLGQTAAGQYRFRINGKHKSDGSIEPYELVSEAFDITPWQGIQVSDLRLESDGASFLIAPVEYPRSYDSIFAVVGDDGLEDALDDPKLCKACSFRPWARSAELASAKLWRVSSDGSAQAYEAELIGGRWYVVAPALAAEEHYEIRPGDVRDEFGEINGELVALGSN